MNARNALRKYFAEELDQAALVASLTDDDSLLEKGILDSIQIVKLTTFLEETFGITVGDDELVPENFETIASLARYVESKS